MSDSLSILPNDLSKATSKPLNQFTFARIGLGRTGVGIPIKEVLAFRAAHAAARDAIFATFETERLASDFAAINIDTIEISSSTKNRQEYLQRPDLGRTLDEKSITLLESHTSNYDISITISDGLSALAANQHAVPLFSTLYFKLQNAGYSIAPLVLLNRGRVAASDQIGETIKAKLSLILIGERPGLSSPDSLGAYLTFEPKTGNTDEKRNCVSNIRPQGLNYNLAAEKLFYLISNALTKKISGVELKDEMNLL